MATRLDFAALPPGSRVVPVVLVAGINAVFVPAGCGGVTTIATSGSLDSAFWTGAGALGAGVLKALLDPSHEFSFSTEARIIEGDVEQSALSFDLYDTDSAATALLSSRDSGAAQVLGADLTAAAVSITLQSTAGFSAGGGVAYVGREAIEYTGILGNDLTGCTRGCYGSRAVLHSYDQTRPALVTSVPRWWMGRRASFWLAALSADGATLTDPTLVFLGVVGTGVQLIEGGAKWRVPVDSITEALSRKLDSAVVRVHGINHFEGSADYVVNALGPLAAAWSDDSYSDPEAIVALCGDSAAPHNGGWHKDWTSFLTDWNALAATVWGGDGSAALSADKHVDILARHVGITWPSLLVQTGWDTTRIANGVRISSTAAQWRSNLPVPEAFIPLAGCIKLPFASDFAKVPTTLSYSSATGGATARWSLSGKLGDKAFTCTVEERDAGTQSIGWRVTPESLSALGWDPGRPDCPCLTTPTTLKLSVHVEGDLPDEVLRLLAQALDLLGGADYHYDSVDWTAFAAAVDANPSPVPGRISVDVGEGEETFLTIFAQLARLSGLAMCLRYGRLSVYRPGDLSATELVARTVTASDLVQPVEVVDAEQALATSVRFELPSGDVVEHVDTSFVDLFGAGEAINLRVSAGLDGSSADADAWLRSLAWGILYPLGQPWRTITLHLPLPFLDVQVGDVLSVTHPVVPSFTGTRGITGALAQVQSTELRTFGGRARVLVKARLSEGTLKGWAPEALVAVGGLVDGSPDVHLDVGSAWGGRCFGQTAASPTADGGAANFSVGDKVELWEIDDATPDSQTGFTVTGISGHVVTLDGNANAAMAGHAASQYKVMLRFAPYDTATSTQHEYAFVADASFGLGAGADLPHRWGG